MKSNQLLKGVLYVAAGASSYGLLATFVKLAYQNGYHTLEVTFAQLAIGLAFMTCLSLFQRKQRKHKLQNLTKKDIYQLIIAGTSIGLTSLFYYISVRYINVSIAIVLLMQSTWISVLLESIITKKKPSLQKIIAVLIVFIGTLLATNVLKSDITLDVRGLFFGMLAAISFTLTMFASNRVANHLPVYIKSNYMLLGGFIIILGYGLFNLNLNFKWDIFYTYGIILALFGTILPPMAFNKGFPKTGLGLGSIVSALELPVSIFMAYLLLKESILMVQIIGIILILLAIVLMNIKFNKAKG